MVAVITTSNDPVMSGKAPYLGFLKDVGNHSVPKRKSNGETLLKIGIASLNRNMNIKPKIIIDKKAEKNRALSIIRSFRMLI